MNWTELLKDGIEGNYSATEKLMDMVDDSKLDWKPASGKNWMTMGQLLMHITNACGMCCKGFVTGDWGMPEDMDISDLKPEEMLPPAEKMPTVQSVAEAKELLAQDKHVALDMLDKTNDDELSNKRMPAPWCPQEKYLGHHLLNMIDHLALHKAQLFYYLKLQGKDVNTAHLCGMV